MLLLEQQTMEKIVEDNNLNSIIEFLNKLGFTELADVINKFLEKSG